MTINTRPALQTISTGTNGREQRGKRIGQPNAQDVGCSRFGFRRNNRQTKPPGNLRSPGVLIGDYVISAKELHFRTGRRQEAESMVMAYHYSRRVPSNIQMVGSLHLDGGLFGGDGEMMAAAFWSVPPTRWSEPVIELTRLVRGEKQVPLSLLISRCTKELKKRGYDLLISFADRTHGHEGYVYRASNWNYSGCRNRAMDGLLINNAFFPGRTCNSLYGTRSVDKVKQMFPEKSVEPHYDEGKHCYWFPLGRQGKAKANRLGLQKNAYPNKTPATLTETGVLSSINS